MITAVIFPLFFASFAMVRFQTTAQRVSPSVANVSNATTTPPSNTSASVTPEPTNYNETTTRVLQTPHQSSSTAITTNSEGTSTSVRGKSSSSTDASVVLSAIILVIALVVLALLVVLVVKLMKVQRMLGRAMSEIVLKTSRNDNHELPSSQLHAAKPRQVGVTTLRNSLYEDSEIQEKQLLVDCSEKKQPNATDSNITLPTGPKEYDYVDTLHRRQHKETVQHGKAPVPAPASAVAYGETPAPERQLRSKSEPPAHSKPVKPKPSRFRARNKRTPDEKTGYCDILPSTKDSNISNDQEGKHNWKRSDTYVDCI